MTEVRYKPKTPKAKGHNTTKPMKGSHACFLIFSKMVYWSDIISLARQHTLQQGPLVKLMKHAKHMEGIASQYAKESQLRAESRGEPHQLHGARRKVGLGARDNDGRLLGTCHPLKSAKVLYIKTPWNLEYHSWKPNKRTMEPRTKFERRKQAGLRQEAPLTARAVDARCAPQ